MAAKLPAIIKKLFFSPIPIAPTPIVFLRLLGSIKTALAANSIFIKFPTTERTIGHNYHLLLATKKLSKNLDGEPIKMAGI